jgi:hypothetical protein
MSGRASRRTLLCGLQHWRRRARQGRGLDVVARCVHRCRSRHAVAVWQAFVHAARLAAAVVSTPPPRRSKVVEISSVAKCFMSTNNIRTRIDLEHHRNAHLADLDALRDTQRKMAHIKGEQSAFVIATLASTIQQLEENLARLNEVEMMFEASSPSAGGSGGGGGAGAGAGADGGGSGGGSGGGGSGGAGRGGGGPSPTVGDRVKSLRSPLSVRPAR